MDYERCPNTQAMIFKTPEHVKKTREMEKRLAGLEEALRRLLEPPTESDNS